ncbi:hypothetical protein [Aureimonas populi]|uniref:Capsular biosynthesis protein n=1 Tax=Aureimonas populi TaxID=1701758 RepID=A0ABW5CL76_9HYPH|nr:hypothetical protein [Aureimonas populi]
MKFPIARRALGLLRSGSLFVQDMVDRATRRATPRLVLRDLDAQVLRFFEKKTPFAEKYPYEVHYAPTLRNVPEGLGAFHLIGRNWRHRPEAPVALAFGFNMWKFGFVADYCPDVRIAFAPRKFLGLGARRAVKRMHPMPRRIYVWGYTDPSWIARYARRYKIELVRVEDAFLRSADLGANHATPYSLVFDSKGLYYNTAEPNDLSELLSNHDFAGDTALMADAERALRLIVENGLSKYNLPDTSDPAARLRIKTRRRVLVIGQVDNDAAVRMGNPGGWRMGDIIRLARLENPDAEILYRPHPEVYRGHQRTRFKAGLVENIAEIVPPEGSLVELLKTTDQVYTISSLSGLEALVRGVKVTTLGTPFYAGWGATDDRTAQPKGRTLTPLEIFAATYILYARYLVPLENPSDAIEATLYRILADKYLLTLSQINHDVKTSAEAMSVYVASDHWPSVVFSNLQSGAKFFDQSQSNAGRIPLSIEFRERKEDRFHLTVLCLLTGWARSPVHLSNLVKQSSTFVSRETMVQYFNYLSLIEKEWNHHKFIANYLRSADSAGEAAVYLQSVRQDVFAESVDLEPSDASAEGEEPVLRVENADKMDFYYELAQSEFDRCRYEESRRICYLLLLNGYKQVDCIRLLINIELILFGSSAANAIASLLPYTGEKPDVLRALSVISETFERNDPSRFAFINSALIAASCSQVARLLLPMNAVENTAEFQRIAVLLTKHVYLSSEISIAKVNALIALGDTKGALEVARSLFQKVPTDHRNAVALSQALVAADQVEEARRLIESTLIAHPYSVPAFKEALRVCVISGDYAAGKKVLALADDRKLPVGEMSLRKMYFGLRQPKEAFETFRSLGIVESLRRHFPDEYYSGRVSEFDGDSLFAAALFGPGDEIRFASLYNDFEAALGGKRLSIGCEPRLLTLFARSFPHIEFVPVARKPRKADAFDVAAYDRIRNSALRAIIDNRAVDAIGAASHSMVVTDALAEFRTCYEDFPGTDYLRPDPDQTRKFSSLLPAAPLRVGISWRSSLNTFSRNEHYLSVEELLPVFELDGIQFINLQYDECSNEVALVNERFPGRLFDPDWVEQYNELDKVASLISALDLVIAPATTVVELAGAVGAPTWMLSNSSELHWRKLDGTDQDVWHHSLTHVEGPILQNKASLVEALRAKLVAWRDERSQGAAAE